MVNRYRKTIWLTSGNPNLCKLHSQAQWHRGNEEIFRRTGIGEIQGPLLASSGESGPQGCMHPEKFRELFTSETTPEPAPLKTFAAACSGDLLRAFVMSWGTAHCQVKGWWCLGGETKARMF